jgi:3',5'-cyclic AMP phosphodiesterase CpdA
MSVIAHLSDLHFGSDDPEVAEALLAELDGRSLPVPTLVAISGDLTQRAREAQFRACRAWLDRLPGPYLVVPGNHDVPLFDVVRRFHHPFERYCRWINDELMPRYRDDELAVIGVNTAHSFTIKDGRLSEAQVGEVVAFLADAGTRCKVLVAHHPFVLPPGVARGDRVDGAEAAVPRLEDAGLDLILSGHLHTLFLGDTAAFRSLDRAIVAVQAGTGMSTRRRGEPNSYNRLLVEGDLLTILQRRWNGSVFVDAANKQYQRQAGRWRKLAEAKAMDDPVAML